MPRAIGIGLVGCGSNGQIHCDGLAKLVGEGEIRAVIAGDPSPDAQRAANRNCRFEHLTGSPGEVVAHPDVDAVLIAGPTATHREAVLAAVSAGKAVMCEKPLAPSFDQVRELANAVAASGVVAQVGFHSRFNPMFARLREMIADAELGAPLGYMLREDRVLADRFSGARPFVVAVGPRSGGRRSAAGAHHPRMRPVGVDVRSGQFGVGADAVAV